MTSTGMIGGRYRLGQTLGRGGMAAVHRALDTQLNREVAVKLMRADLGDEPAFQGRFVNEARNAASISHPNVVTVFDFGTEGPGPYLVMELVEGGDLAGLIAREAPLPPQRAAAIASEVASALQAAHARGIVHRDVKPGNILIAADGHPRVADFGIARATGEQSMTATGDSLGSVQYFSPEQARGDPATASSDLYALGVVLYEMLAGSRPFAGDSSYAVAVARLEAPPPDPRRAHADVPAPLAAIVQRAMATDPLARFASAADLGAALAGWVARNPAPEASLAALATSEAASDAAPSVRPPVAARKVARSTGVAATRKTPVPRGPSGKTSAAPPPAPKSSRARKSPLPAAAAVARTPPAVPQAKAASVAPAADPAAETRPVSVVRPAVPAAPASAAPVVPAPHALPAAMSIQPSDDDRRRRRPPVLLLAAAVVLLAVIGFAGSRLLGGGEDGATGVTVGTPRGALIGSTPEPTEEPTQRPTVEPTEEPTLEPTLEPTVAPNVAPTAAPIAAATPAPAPPAPPPSTPAPTPVAVAQAITPDQTVAAWYSYVQDGQFEAAYALWSNRMRANFPRQGNLDNRWHDTASISILDIGVTQQTQTYAVVYIDFIETKDNGSSRRYTGAWELVRSGDRWLLDQPHF